MAVTIKELKDEFFNDLSEKDESFIVSKWILHKTPFIFNENVIEYIEWKELLSQKIKVDSRAICLTGSSCLGFSLNPTKKYKDFDEESDIDIAIISNHYFDLSWHYLRNMGAEIYKLNSEEKASVEEHENQLIFWGTIATDEILTILPFGSEWFKGLSFMSTLEKTEGREINVRIYKDYESFRAYNIDNIKKLKIEYLNSLYPQETLR